MDFLDNVMELLNSTPSPPINAVNNQHNNNRESSSLENSVSIEPNNLSQTDARVVATAAAMAAGGEIEPVTQTFGERNLELKLPILSSSSSDSESEETTTNPAAGASAENEGERAVSPPPNCAICLGRCKNKCFTDSCMHQFCFKCLCEWSKVKPECPLCKQTFKSIIHNVKSIHQFEEYHVQPPAVQITHPPFEMDFQEMRIFGVVHPGHNRNQAWNETAHRPFFYGDFPANPSYSSSRAVLPAASSSSGSNRSGHVSGNGSGLHNQYIYRGELLDLYRQEYPGAIANSGTLSQLWRRYVYDRKLYAMPVADITGRFRESSARFYRENPSQIHRLMPWINRDIVCLLRHSQHDVTAVLESINSALTIMNILSPAFRRRLQPFFGNKTAHFIHELNNFARSPYDMIGYDRAVQYSIHSNNEEIVIEFSSSDESTDNDHIDVAGDGSGTAGGTISSTSRSRSTNASTINAINLTIHNRLTSAAAAANGSGGSRGGDRQGDVSLVIDLRGESDNNETTSTGQATINSSNYQNGQNAAGTSEGDVIMSSTQPTVSENIELTSGSSDECEFILERKPPHLRTPEMVSLDSASDSDVVFVDESKPLNKTSFSSSEEERDVGKSENKSHNRNHNKLFALVEAKRRNHSTNVVKSEHNDMQTEVYNLGASTSAALRLSLQRRVDAGRTASSSSTRQRREKYSLRNTERQVPKRRGKRLDSESSHSSTSASSSSSFISPSSTSLLNSSLSSSDEDYAASTSQKRREDSSRKLRKVRETKQLNTSNIRNRRTVKCDSRTRKKTSNDYTSEEEDDEKDNDHMGKNYALVMAINERQERQNKKFANIAQESDNKEDSEGENSWRLKAVREPLRKQQQERVRNSRTSNERKRHRKISTQEQTPHTESDKDERKRNRKRQKLETVKQKESDCQIAKRLYKNNETSSDESDNINLIELKTKLIGKDQDHKGENKGNIQNITTTVETAAVTTTTHLETQEMSNCESPAVTATNEPAAYTVSLERSIIPTITGSTSTESLLPSSTTAIHSAEAMMALKENNVAATNNTAANSKTEWFNTSDDESNDNKHINTNHSNQTSYTDDCQQLPSSSLRNFNDSHIHDNENVRNDNLCDDEDNDEALCNNPTNINQNERNVYDDGTTMSTTTNDTILHEAAEQISSAAVNFYNTQQSFNTAVFNDDNSTNSSISSSDSSLSSSTTSLSSSSNSSSSNDNNYTSYKHS